MFRISQVPLLHVNKFKRNGIGSIRESPKKYIIDMRKLVASFDFGSAISRIAVLDKNSHAKILLRPIPSVVAFKESGERLVGARALNQAGFNIQNTVYCFKQLIGLEYDGADVNKKLESFPFKIVKSSDGDALIESHGHHYSTSQLYSFIIEEVKKVTTQKITGAVISVPAYFNDSQRRIIIDAFNLANLHVIGMLDEPVAAALAYGLNVSDNKRIAVYHMSGGAFDISILEIKDGKFIVKSAIADSFLIAKNFDNAFVHHRDLLNLFDDVIDLPADFLNQTVELCNKAMVEANCEPDDIDLVLLTGGMTLLPEVRELVYGIFDKRPCSAVSPDEAILIGSCILANGICADYPSKEYNDRVCFEEAIQSLDAKPRDITRCLELLWLGSSYLVRMLYAEMGIGINTHTALVRLCYFASSFLPDDKSKLVQAGFDLAQTHGAGLSEEIMRRYVEDIEEFAKKFSTINKKKVKKSIQPYLDKTVDKKNKFLKDVDFTKDPEGDYIGSKRYHFTYIAT